MSDPIKAFMLVIDGVPSLEDIYPVRSEAEMNRERLEVELPADVYVVAVEIREAGE